MTKTLQTKPALNRWVLRTEEDEPGELMRYVDTDDERDCRNAIWTTSLERAERSWRNRHVTK